MEYGQYKVGLSNIITIDIDQNIVASGASLSVPQTWVHNNVAGERTLITTNS